MDRFVRYIFLILLAPIIFLLVDIFFRVSIFHWQGWLLTLVILWIVNLIVRATDKDKKVANEAWLILGTLWCILIGLFILFSLIDEPPN